MATLPINSELYLRTFMNDLGQAPAEQAQANYTDVFNLVSQSSFTLSHSPSSSFTPLVYFNGILQQSSFYAISGTGGTLTNPQTGQLIVAYMS